MSTGQLSDEQKRLLDEATSMYVENLGEVLPYLEARGIGKDTALSRGLGFVKSPAIPEHRGGKGRLAIPYITPAGVVGITFRCVQSHVCREVEKHSKYWKPQGQVSVLYGVTDMHKATLDIHVAEGELDAITLSELCSLPAVGISGSKYWQEWWPEVFKDFRRVFVFCDGDKAGEEMGHKIARELGRSVIPISLPAGEDVNSFYLKYGPEPLREMAK